MRHVGAVGAILIMVGALGLLVVPIAYRYYTPPVFKTDTSAIQRELEEEFAAIIPRPGSVRTSYHSIAKPENVLVDAAFRAAVSYADLRSYYDQELSRNGWQFCGEERLKEWGRDLGGMAAHYRKGDYRASVNFAGEQADYGWTYALDLSWGLTDECKRE